MMILLPSVWLQRYIILLAARQRVFWLLFFFKLLRAGEDKGQRFCDTEAHEVK